MTDPTIDAEARGLYEWDRRIALINRVRELEAQRDAVLAVVDDMNGGRRPGSLIADRLYAALGVTPTDPGSPPLTDLVGLYARQGGGDAGEARQAVSEQRRRDKGAQADSVPICRDPEHRHTGRCDRWQPIGQTSPCGPECPVHPRGLAGHGPHASDAMASVIATGLENAARPIETKGTKGS